MVKNKCCLCGITFVGYGNDPWPLKPRYFGSKVCCNGCNATKVLKARIELNETSDKTYISTMYGKERS